MATGTTFSVKYRRKREQKTNYKKRLNLLKSHSIRLVVRPTNKNILAQLVEYEADGDKILSHAKSTELAKLGWKYSKSNTPSAYLVGLLCGIRAKEKGVEAAILDSGLHPHIKGSKIYACVKGLLDAGIAIPIDEEVIPGEDRITGKTIASYVKGSDGMEGDFANVKDKIMGSK